jgi:putative acetyltransferase
MRIRAEQPQDLIAIHDLISRCFPTQSEATLVDALRASEARFISLAALEVHDRVIGHVCFTPVRTLDGRCGMGLAPLAVDAAFRRNGVGAALVTAGLSRCGEEGVGWVVVLGKPSYYSRFGFRAASEFGLADTYGGGDAFQALELKAAALPRGAGVVHYAAAFGSL